MVFLKVPVKRFIFKLMEYDTLSVTYEYIPYSLKSEPVFYFS